MNTTATPAIAVDERTVAAALGVSCSYLKVDRRTTKLIPFTRLGSRVVYNLDRVREVLAAREEGGVVPKVESKARGK